MAEKSNDFGDKWWRKIILSFLCGGMAIWVYSDLSSLESGAKASVRVWWPIALLYNNIGYWPSVLLLPCIGILLLIYGISQLVKEQSETAIRKI